MLTTLLPQVDKAKLREARENAGLTLEQMGDHLFVGRSQVANIEAGRSDITANDLAMWARVCGKPIADLYTDAAPNSFTRRKKVSKNVQ